MVDFNPAKSANVDATKAPSIIQGPAKEQSATTKATSGAGVDEFVSNEPGEKHLSGLDIARAVDLFPLSRGAKKLLTDLSTKEDK